MEINHIFNDVLKFREKYKGTHIVLKFGGALAGNDDAVRSIGRQAAFLQRSIGAHIIMVHGGQNQIDEALAKENIESKKISKTGVRETDQPTLNISDDTLRALNGRVVRLMQETSPEIKALGMAGYDGRLITAKQEAKFTGSNPHVETNLLNFILQQKDQDIIPVIYPICWSEAHPGIDSRLNVNADTVAASIASSMKAHRLILCSDISGVLDKQGQKLSSLSTEEIDDLIDNGVVTGGMINKVRMAAKAAGQMTNGGVVILNGYEENAILTELLYEEGIGTLVRRPDQIPTQKLEND
jgi:acetylglutamate kinase